MVSIGNRKCKVLVLKKGVYCLTRAFQCPDEYVYTSGGERDPSGGAGASGNGFHPSWGNYGSDSNGECSVPTHHRWHGKCSTKPVVQSE